MSLPRVSPARSDRVQDVSLEVGSDLPDLGIRLCSAARGEQREGENYRQPATHTTPVTWVGHRLPRLADHRTACAEPSSTVGRSIAARLENVGSSPHWRPAGRPNSFYGTQIPQGNKKSSVDAAILINYPGVSGIHDPTLIYFPYVFVGPMSASRYIIDGTVAPVIGNNWCTSGASSGTHCGAKIHSTKRVRELRPGWLYERWPSR